MGREKREIGMLGEGIALKFLEDKGYKIKCRNFRTPFGELDIVAKHKGSLVFIEVRTRSTSSLGPPVLSVTRIKQIHIIRNALFYLKRYGRAYADWRIDVICIKLGHDLQPESIDHIENAVEDIM